MNDRDETTSDKPMPPLDMRPLTDAVNQWVREQNAEQGWRIASHLWRALSHIWSELSEELRADIMKDAPADVRATLDRLPDQPVTKGAK